MKTINKALLVAEMTADIKAALEAGSKGAFVFNYIAYLGAPVFHVREQCGRGRGRLIYDEDTRAIEPFFLGGFRGDISAAIAELEALLGLSR